MSPVSSVIIISIKSKVIISIVVASKKKGKNVFNNDSRQGYATFTLLAHWSKSLTPIPNFSCHKFTLAS
jgi:hypothetical protein